MKRGDGQRQHGDAEGASDRNDARSSYHDAFHDAFYHDLMSASCVTLYQETIFNILSLRTSASKRRDGGKRDAGVLRALPRAPSALSAGLARRKERREYLRRICRRARIPDTSRNP